MSPILTALKALYVALGGALTDHYDDIAGGIPVSQMVLTADLVTCMSKLTIGGGGLPEVTDADNGDVLKVVNGEWAKSEADSTLYHHFIAISYTDDELGGVEIRADLITKSGTQMTLSELNDYLYDNSAKLPVSGNTMTGGSTAPAYLSATASKITLVTTNSASEGTITAGATFTDTVVEL